MKTLLLSLLLALPVAAAESIEFEGKTIPLQRDELRLHGTALLRGGMIFRVYAAALYLENEKDALRILEEVPKQLDIYYFHKTPPNRMIAVANETLRKNLSAEEYKKLKPKIDRLHAAYRAGKKGSYASIVYRPGEGTRYLFDGKEIIHIEGFDFSAAYFSIWLGSEPSSKTVKKELLKKRKKK